MESMQRTLKVLSICVIIMAVITIIFSAVSLASGTFLGSAGLSGTPVTEEEQDVQTVALAMGILVIVIGVAMLLVGIFDLITGIMGLRGAKGDFRAAGKAKVMGGIGLFCIVAYDVYTLCTGFTWENAVSAVIGIAIQVIFVVAAGKVQHMQGNTLGE